MNNQNEIIRNQLKENLDTVNYWLAFAEAKNFALIAFNIASIAAILALNDLDFLLYIIVIGLVFSIIVSLFYTIPKYATKAVNNLSAESQNLLFYKNIVSYTKEGYIKDLYQRYYNENIKIDDMAELELDYAEEIVENAKIACKKYQGVNLAIKIDILSLIFFIVEIILVA